jgi:cytoskeleton-associated protein 5
LCNKKLTNKHKFYYSKGKKKKKTMTVLGEKSNFQGQRGGDAHDAELLALLRGVSAKSGAADRFAGGDDNDNDTNDDGCIGIIETPDESQSQQQQQPLDNDKSENIDVVQQDTSTVNNNTNAMTAGSRKKTSRDPNEVPPWKRGKGKNTMTGKNSFNAMEDEDAAAITVVVSPPSKRMQSSSSSHEQEVDDDDDGGGNNNSTIIYDDDNNNKRIESLTATSTFQGERGGDAHDEELLALLRGVSAKSGAVDRFSGGDDIDDGNGNGDGYAINSKQHHHHSSNNNRENNEVPPWKRGKDIKDKAVSSSKSSFEADTSVVVDAAAPKPTSSSQPIQDTLNKPLEKKVATKHNSNNNNIRGNFDNQNKSNFKGDRGGDAHDEELLALLRGVSSNSGGADRFATEDDEQQQPDGNLNNDDNDNDDDEKLIPVQEEKEIVQKNNTDDIPPWKRKKVQKSKPVSDVGIMDDVVVAVKPTRSSIEDNVVREVEEKEEPPKQNDIMDGNGNLKTESNFQGQRGGDAHDEELLALLRGVSAKSRSADRFAENNDDGGITETVVSPPVATSSELLAPNKPAPSRQSVRDSDQLPPWKRGKAQKSTKAVDLDVIVAAKSAPPTPPKDTIPTDEPLGQEAVMGGGVGNFKNESNFQGERGGDAHDEELLALLRGVSSKSASADRFAGGDDDDDEHNEMTADQPVVDNTQQTPPSPPPSTESSEQISPSSNRKKKGWFSPPWKKNKKKQTKNNDGKENLGVESKQSCAVPSTVKDASSQPVEAPSSNAVLQGGGGNFKQQESTFKGDRGGDAHDEELLALLRGVSSKNNNADRFADDDKEGKQTEVSSSVEIKIPTSLESISTKEVVSTKKEADNTPNSAVLHGGGGNFKQQESTFKGDRGGEAHDEELLALLRGVSSKAGGSDRFAGGDQEEAQQPQVSKPPSQPLESSQRQSEPISASSSGPSPFPSSGGVEEGEIVVTLEDLPSAFSDKNWKVRKESYTVLEGVILEAANGVPLGSIDADEIVPGLDALIPKLFSEKNAAALEFAMNAGIEYANACKGGSSEAQAAAIVSALLKGNGFSSPRPTSVKAVTGLVLKIMEVGSDPSSLTSVVTLLVDKGLVSKKPKVVQLSASLILEATHSFGAAHLPLAAISTTLPKILTHSNKKIRDIGMEIVAEFCRAFESKDPLEQVISKMQKSQVKDLDSLLAKRADAVPVKIGLRCLSVSGNNALSAADAFAALQAGSEELEKERFENRLAVNLIDEITKTEYASKLKLAKWSEKVGAMDIVLKCGGEKPYKLAQPSSSNNYAPLISDMKGLLTHTHFAVVSKAMGILAMLAQGVGERLYSNLRPLLPKLLQLSKDKKLTKGVSSCLDACFGNVFGYDHLLDSDSSIPDAANEGKEKNKLARTSALDFLDRCVIAGASAGPRAALTPSNAKACAKFASQKLGDSDANVRKSALQILSSLQKVDDEEVQSTVSFVIEELQQSHPRAYKSLSKTGNKKPASSASTSSSAVPKKANAPTPQSSFSQDNKKAPSTRSMPSTQKRAPPAAKIAIVTKPTVTEITRGNNVPPTESIDGAIPSLEEALDHCGSLDIPLWDESGEDKGGVLVGIKATKWQSRLKAIQALTEFVNSRLELDDCNEVENDSNCLLVVVKEHTKKFKESNFNVARGIMELFSALCDYHERSQCRFSNWAITDGTALAVEKIADKKLSSLSKSLLLTFCTVHPPHTVLTSACTCAEKLRAPLAHEEFLNWMETFCNEFGAASIGSSIQEIVPFLKTECGAKNVKVKRAAFATIGLMHAQLGPSLRAVTLSSISDSSFRGEFEKIFKEHPFDSSLTCADWPMRYLFSNSSNDNTDSNSTSGMKIELPKTDLIAELPPDCLSRMGSKDGKTAWKARKAALEDVEKALKNTSGLLDTSKMRPLVELLRAMRDRLTDTQINLKPIAARLIGLVLSSVEGEAQGKLGKVVYAPVMNAAMNDKRKVMNDAAMEALQKSISIPEIEGEEFNEHSLEPFVVALIGELDESEFKSAGIAGILTLTQTLVQHLPDLEKISSQRGESVGGRFSKVLVNALSSSKAEIRSAAESLLSECLANDVFSMQTAKKSMGRLVPAKQRSVGMLLAKMSSASTSDSRAKNEPSSSKPPSGIRSAVNKSAPVERMQKSETQKSKQSYPRPPVEKSRVATHAKPRVQNDEVKETASSFHPLIYDIGSNGVQKSQAAMRSLTWPEYPEEPSGSALYSGLKKAWAPIIPPNSLKILFPDKGIRKLDDVMGGFDLLRQAIAMDKENEGLVVLEQLHFILRYSVFALGCKETTVGLGGLLDMIAGLLSYLHGLKYEFSDSEITIFAPFLFEKASVAKGRFKDMYMDLIRSIKSDPLLPAKRLGPFVCVPLMESSSQAKARLLACQTCYNCVEKNGLSGIGKKGVLVAAKALSNEKLPENRTAFLDLMVLLVSRMHNDTQRLSKICGSSLSNKARVLIEEHMHKAPPTPSKASPAKVKSPSHSHSSRLQRPSQPSPASIPTRNNIEDDYKNLDRTAPSVFQDELPALDLRRVLRERESPIKSNHGTPTRPSFSSSNPGYNRSENLFSSSLTSTTSSSFRETSVIGNTAAVSRSEQQINSNLASASSESDQSGLLSSSGSSPIGAAASLRARLLKIRESNRLGTGAIESTTTPISDTEGFGNSQYADGSRSEMLTSQNGSLRNGQQDDELFLENSLEIIRKLLEKSNPILETDDDLIACTDVLKNIHAAVSKQANLAVMIDASSVTNLREEIKGRISEIVGILTQLIDFGFNCHPKNVSAGMSVPLLSVNLAGLMAIFRSSDLATLVNVDDLTILIKEAGTALLDPRLAQKSGDETQIDEATSTQMVRAINKLAVQAATGAARENALQALIRLQYQLSTNTDAHDNPLFNSRLSRVVTKLSTRVIKAEDGTSNPFSSTNMDMETVLCCLEDTMDNCNNLEQPEGAAATKNIVKLIVMAILKARGESATMRKEMLDLEIDPNSSALGVLTESCAAELGIVASGPPQKSSQNNDVASLVSAVVTATHGPNRNAAIDALKSYKETYGDEELKNHLEDVSPAFRSYLLKELSESPRPPSPETSSTAMSERIKSLRSKLIATEVAVANAASTYPNPSVHSEKQDPVDDGDEEVVSSNTTTTTNGNKSPPSKPTGMNAFRERLAAVQEKRGSTALTSSTEILSPAPKAKAPTAGSRAAALRARLEAVKKQTNK